MSAANDRFPYLGAATEALLSKAFASTAMVTAGAAQAILGLDDKTFTALVEGGAIGYVPISATTKRYTEANLRLYLNRETELTPCRSTSQRKAVSGTSTSKSGGSGFTDRPVRLRVVQPKPSRGNAA